MSENYRERAIREVVHHSAKWFFGGYNEIKEHQKRKATGTETDWYDALSGMEERW